MASLKLKTSDFKKYSGMEEILFALIPHDGSKIDTEELTKLFYRKRRESIPMTGRTIVSGTINSLIEKIDRNKEPYRMCRSARSGPISTWVWIEKRPRKRSGERHKTAAEATAAA